MAASKSGSYFAAWQREPSQLPINGNVDNWRIPPRLKKSHSDKSYRNVAFFPLRLDCPLPKMRILESRKLGLMLPP